MHAPREYPVRCTRCFLKLSEYFKAFKWCPLCLSHGVRGTLVHTSSNKSPVVSIRSPGIIPLKARPLH